MAKNVNHIQHIKSNVVLEGKPKLPESGTLVEGELAINYADGVETISIKNSNGDIITFSSDNYYSKQKLGSAFTDANSAVTVTDEFELYVKKTDVDQVLDNSTSASTNPVSTSAVYSAITDNELVWTNAYVALSGVVSSHTVDTNIHITSADRDKLDSITDSFGTMAYENTSSYSSATQVNTALGNKASSSDLTTLSGTVTAHTASTTMHLTSSEKSQLHTHTNKTYLDNITGNVGTMAYENTSSYSSASQVNTALSSKLESSDIAGFFDKAKYELSGTTHVINFYHGNTIKSTIDATDFIKDGMIDTVSAGTSATTTVLVITWNTDAGKSQTILDIGDMFEADNYYTTGQTSGKTEISTALAGKANTATTLAGYGITDAYTKTEVNNKLGSGFTSSSVTEVIESNERVTASALNDLNTNKLDASAYTPTDLSNYYTKSQTSGASEISTALNGKSGTGHTHDDRYYTESELTGSATTVVVAKAASATTAASANSVAWGNVSAKPETYAPSAHNHASSEISAMTGYAKASTAADVAVSDTLNQAIGKLEKRIYELERGTETIAAALVELNSKFGEIEELLSEI